MMRLLLSAGGGGEVDEDAAVGPFEEVTLLVIFLLLAWVSGKAVTRLRLPSLLGELVVGMVFGPHLLDLVPHADALRMLGEVSEAYGPNGGAIHSNAIPLASTDTRARGGTQVGLLLLVVEAGLEVDLGTLKQIGVRGLTVAVLGSFGPLGVGTLLTHYGLGLDLMSSLAVGCSLAPTSMAIGLAVLKANGRLRTPSGQLIIAAAVIDDVIALILLSELRTLQDPNAMGFIVPIVSSVLFVVAFLLVATLGIPRLMRLGPIKRMPRGPFVWIAFFALFLLALGLTNACYYAMSSYLLGAFLAGLCFCTVEPCKNVWQSQGKEATSIHS